MLYVDTSVLVAALTQETRTHAAQAWLSRNAHDRLVVSDWVLTEFSAALSMKVRRRELGAAERAEVLAMFAGILDRSLEVLPVRRSDFEVASRYADQHRMGLRGGDALHLAVAANHGARLRALDRALVKAAGELGVSAALI